MSIKADYEVMQSAMERQQLNNIVATVIDGVTDEVLTHLLNGNEQQAGKVIRLAMADVFADEAAAIEDEAND